MEQFPLRGRTALVTGASRGIGAATARALDAAGARVALTARDTDALTAVAHECANEPITRAADLSDPDQVLAVAQWVLDEFGSIDILVNNAGISARLDSLDVDAGLIDRLYDVNVRAPLLLIGKLIPSMTERRSGSIINLSSVSSVVGTPRRSAYAATKGAIDAATRSLAMELGPFGVRVNAVAPGVVDTELWSKNKAIPGVIASVEALTPLGRWGTVDDVADVIVFLATDAARFITGEVISVDGGMARTLDLYARSNEAST